MNNPRRRTFSEASWGLARHHPTCLWNPFAVNCKGSNRGSANGRGLPEEANGIGDRRKTTETESRSSQSTVYACTRSYPPNLNSWRMPTNQITALPERARWHARVCRQALRVYKPSPVVSKPFGLGLARVRLR